MARKKVNLKYFLSRILGDLDKLQFDTEGRLLTTAELALSEDPSKNKVFVYATDGTNVVPLKTDTSGDLYVLPIVKKPDGTIVLLPTDSDGIPYVNIKNAELAVALTASEDSVLAYGKETSTGTIYPLSVDSEGRIRSVVENTVSIDGVVSVDSEPAYDSTADLKKVSVERDNVGLAKDATLAQVRDRLPANLTTNGNFRVAIAEDQVNILKEGGNVNVTNIPTDYARDYSITRVQQDVTGTGDWRLKIRNDENLANIDVALSTRASESTLSQLNSKIPSPTASGNLPIAIAEDTVGVAKDSTVQKLANALASIGTDKILTTPDNPPNLDVALSTRASETTLNMVYGVDYDCMVRRGCGRLLALVDFTLKKPDYPVDEFDLGYVIVVGALSYGITTWSAEGIPMPEGTGSPYVLKIVVPANGTAYVRVPVKASYFKTFSAYITVYNKDYEMQYNFYISLGGYYQTGTRQKPPKPLHLPANQWGRFIAHWFMEAHHGSAEVDIEIINPNAVDVTVYVGMITACEIGPHIKGHCLLLGWEGNFYIPLNNETFDWFTDIMLPTDVDEFINLWTSMGIQSDDGTTIEGWIYFHPGARQLSYASTTTSAGLSRDFKVWNGRHGYYGYQTFTIEYKASTTGAGRITYLQVVLRCFSKENTYQKWFEGTIGSGSSVTLVDYWNDVKHVKSGKLKITAPSDGDVEVHGETPEGDIVINKVKAGTTDTVEIIGRYHKVYLRNLSTTTSANYQGWLEISESLLIK